MTTQKAVNATHLTKCFETNAVINDCTMQIQQGCIYGLLGENGVGKTTLFKLLTGLLTPECVSA